MIKIRDFRNKKNIRLYVISNPIPDCIFEAIPQMHDFIETSKEFMAQENITFIDASDDSVFPGFTKDEKFRDCFGHFCGEYRTVFSKQFCDVLKIMKN